MSTRPRPMEPAWHGAFRVADAVASGVGRSRLRRADLVAPHRGVRAQPGSSSIEAYAPLLRPGERFSHVTAARLWGAPLPDSADPRLHVTVDADRTRARSPRVVGHRSGSPRSVVRLGMPVSCPDDLVVELAPLIGLDALVAVVDHLVLAPRFGRRADPRPYAMLPELAVALRARHGRGVVVAREAVGLARVGAESPAETRLRLLALRAGLPEPECNAEVSDRFGRIGFFDLVWHERKVIAEYDGDHHRTSTEQYEIDIARFDRASADGWRVVRVRSRGLRRPDETARRLREAFSRR